MGKKDRERIGRLEAEIDEIRGAFTGAFRPTPFEARPLGRESHLGVLDRLAALEGRLEALEAKRRAFTPTTGQSKMLEFLAYDEVDDIEDAAAPERTLWWFDRGWWVKDRTSDEVNIGDVWIDPFFGGVPCRSSGRAKGSTRTILRPAKTFPATAARSGLVESGEVKPPWRGDWYTAGGGIAEQCRQSFAPDDPAYPILIPISEARKRCGVEDDRHEGGLPGTMEDRVREVLAQRDKAEARVKELETRMDPDPEWMRERLQRYTGSPEHVDTLVNLIRDWPNAPFGVRLDGSLRTQLREALEPFGVDSGRPVRHEGVDG